jgi:uncharacterized protein YndB with AHSA1/START domain
LDDQLRTPDAGILTPTRRIDPMRPVPADTGAELVITRMFNAPRALVFKAWTDPAMMVRWFGPRHHPATSLSLDLTPGGKWSGCLRSVADGSELRLGGVFREIIPPERLVFSFAWDEPGERGLETIVTIEFEALGDQTRMTLRQVPFRSTTEQDGHQEGWSSCFDRLAEHLAAA